MERAVGTLKRRRKRSPAPDDILKLAFAMACTLALLNEVFPSIAGHSKMPENTVGTIGLDDEVAAVVCDTSSCTTTTTSRQCLRKHDEHLEV